MKYILPSFNELTRNLEGGFAVNSEHECSRSLSVSSLDNNGYSYSDNRNLQQNYEYTTSQPRVYEFPTVQKDLLRLVKRKGEYGLRSSSSATPDMPLCPSDISSDLSVADEIYSRFFREWESMMSLMKSEQEMCSKITQNHSTNRMNTGSSTFLRRFPIESMKNNLERMLQVIKKLEDEKTRLEVKTVSSPKPNHHIYKSHRRAHSSSARIQGGHTHKTQSQGDTINKWRWPADIGEDMGLMDIEVNPMRVIASAKAVEGIEDPTVSSTGGLHEELSIHPKPLECNHCTSTISPEWRRGPDGKRTLCNACGLFYSKLYKKHGKQRAHNIMLERKKLGAKNDRSIQ